MWDGMTAQERLQEAGSRLMREIYSQKRMAGSVWQIRPTAVFVTPDQAHALSFVGCADRVHGLTVTMVEPSDLPTPRVIGPDLTVDEAMARRSPVAPPAEMMVDEPRSDSRRSVAAPTRRQVELDE